MTRDEVDDFYRELVREANWTDDRGARERKRAAARAWRDRKLAELEETP